MFEKTILDFHGLEIKLSDHASEGILDILSHAVQGSEGGMRFSLQNVVPRIEAYGDTIRFVSLYRKNKITGTVGACFRMTGQGQSRYPSTYIRYLAFQSTYQSDINWRKKERAIIKSETDLTFKQKTLEIFSKPHLLELPDVFEEDRHIMYAFIESMNERSKNLVSQAGYEYIRSFLTVAFSRFSPKFDNRVTLLGENEKKEMTELLLDYYRNFTFFTPEYSFRAGKYYVLKEEGKIIAGVSAEPATYKIYDMPGIWGWIIMKILPSAPYFRRLFQPGEFRHLVFDSIYCQRGREELLADLLESACAAEGINTGLTWLDDRCELFDRLRTGVKMGALNRLLNAKPGLVYAKFINLSEEEKDYFYDSPAYISGLDFS